MILVSPFPNQWVQSYNWYDLINSEILDALAIQDQTYNFVLVTNKAKPRSSSILAWKIWGRDGGYLSYGDGKRDSPKPLKRVQGRG